MSRLRSSHRGFTLLEVMVAVAILGLGLTAILSAQFGALNGVSYARGMSGAVGYARCKMSEVEEHLRQDGFAELEESDSGPCCGDGSPGYTCEWRIEKPSFPDGTSAKLDLDTSSLGSLGKLAPGSSGDAPAVDPSAGLSGITQALGPDAGSLAAGGVSGIASMVMGMVYPTLKRQFEASSRRITVVIRWSDRGRERSFDVVQWVTAPQTATGVANDAEDLSGLGADATTGTGAGTGTTTGGRR
ncbi:MAG: prepilin-type N-terminal cleavage/methylation domain-containing protein [Deltaproteobacteria bacterium]|nr:prepilin-type N-terminal cleavage/methylation domain-containing protein [Deltaproteobacteria bacterium]